MTSFRVWQGAGMDLDGLTMHTVGDRMRVELGVDVLAGRLPGPRLVVFRGRQAVLAVAGRPFRADEDWLVPIVELVYLGRMLRPGALTLAFPSRLDAPQGPAARFALQVATIRRRHPASFTRQRVEHREHPFTLSPEGLLLWEDVRSGPVPPLLRAVARHALARVPRDGHERFAWLTELLVADGHRITMAPELEEQLDRSGSRAR